MYILEPIPHETIWGGKKLSSFVEGNVGQIGHLYLVNGHREMTNKIINGEFAQKTLREVFDIKKNDWHMGQYQEFPLTVALVDAAESLSIQVHPDDMMAEELENNRIGKRESWLFLNAPKSGWIYNGCECTTLNEVIRAVDCGRMEEITGRLPIENNSYVCVEAGTLHAMTAGSLVYEIEYGSDFTYRFYDYNRVDNDGNKRELQVEKALKSIKLGLKSKAFCVNNEEWIHEKNYEIRIMNNTNNYKNDSNIMEVFSVINGSGCCDSQTINAGMSILLLPGEQLNNVTIEKAVIARLCE